MTRRTLLGAAFAAVTTLLTSPAQAQTWTELKVGDFNSQGYFSGGLSHLPDGRLVLGAQGELGVQTTFGSNTMAVVNAGALTFDPSFIAVQSATSALVGRGGFAASELHGFNPSTPGVAVNSTPLTTLQNAGGVFWKHPTSGREGWLIGGTNSGGRHNVSFVSLSGAQVGALTADLSEYSGAIAVDTQGNLYASLAEDTFTPGPDAADDGKVLKFTAAQVDAAVAAVLAAAPAPIAEASATLVTQFVTSGYLAVDSFGRVYSAGYQTQAIRVYDPASNTAINLTPRTTPLPGANPSNIINYAVAPFVRNGVSHISWIAFDGSGAPPAGADVVYGYAPATSFDVTTPSVSFTASSSTVSELAGTVNLAITLSHRSLIPLTIPLSVSGSSTTADRTVSTAPIVIPAGTTTANVAVKVIADKVDEPVDNETCIVTLGTPTPAGRIVLGVNSSHTLTITDINKPLPVAPSTFTYTSGTVGSGYSGVFFTDYDADLSRAPATYTATGLPTGLTMNRTTGEITGRPTVAGRYANIRITVVNNGGSFVMGPYVIDIADYDAALQGTWVGWLNRDGTVTGDTNAGLGARLDLTTTRAASVSGSLTIGSLKYPFSGTVDTAVSPAASTITVLRRGLPSITLSLSYDAAAFTLAGTASDGSGPAQVSGWRSFWSSTNPALTRQGRHNCALEDLSVIPGNFPLLPEGASYASYTVAATGLVTTAGRSADGIALTGTAPLGRSGQVLHYQALYGGLGSFLATPSITDDTAHTVTGTGSWSKKPQPGSKSYSGGWASPLSLVVNGGLFVPLTGTQLPLGAAATAVGVQNAQMSFAGGGQELSSTTGNCFLRFSTPSAATAFATPPNVVALSVAPNTGIISGSFRATLGTTVSTVPFFAMILPDTGTASLLDGEAAGHFLLTQSGGAIIRSGYVSLERTP